MAASATDRSTEQADEEAAELDLYIGAGKQKIGDFIHFIGYKFSDLQV